MIWLVALAIVLATSNLAQGCINECGEWPIRPPFTIDPIGCSTQSSPRLECRARDRVRDPQLVIEIAGSAITVANFIVANFTVSSVIIEQNPPSENCPVFNCSCGTYCWFYAIREFLPGNGSLSCIREDPSLETRSYVLWGGNCTAGTPEYDVRDLSCSPVGTDSTLFSQSSSSTNRRAALVGGVVGGGVGLFLLLGCICCIARRRSLAVKQRQIILAEDVAKSPFDSHQFLSKSGRVLHSNNSASDGTSNSYSSSVSVAIDGGGGSKSRFSYRELQEATNGFSEDVGDGGFGTVYKGRLNDGRLVAVKKLNPWNAQGKYQFDNEVNILSRVTHPHLVRLYGCCIEKELLLVYEFVANGALADHLHDNPIDFLGWDARLTIAVQCAEALAFLHTNVCYHRDVKSTNILLDEHFHCKVGDFGLSRLVPSLELTHITTAPQGTPGYLDPDYHQSYQLTDKSDVYSLGVVLMELISSQRAVDMSRDRKEINLAALAVSRIQCGELDKLVDPKLKTSGDPVRQRMVESVAELGFECLAAEKEDRPCMKEVAARLRAIEGEGKQRYVEQMVAIRGGRADAAVMERTSSKNEMKSSPTSVQMFWPSNSTSPNDSSSSM